MQPEIRTDSEADDYAVQVDQQNQEIKSIIISLLKKEKDIGFCVLFGSAADNALSRHSDIDIALGAESRLSPERLAELQKSLSSALNREADIVDIRSAEGVFLQQILTKGDLLIRKDANLYAYLLRKMWYFNEDMRKNYEAVRDAQIRRFLDGPGSD